MSDIIVLKIPIAALRDLLRAAEVVPGDKPSNYTPARKLPQRSEEPVRPWTDRQRRLVIKLVYRLGHEGPAARAFIADQLGLGPSDEPSIKQASRLIDSLKSEEGSRGAA